MSLGASFYREGFGQYFGDICHSMTGKDAIGNCACFACVDVNNRGRDAHKRRAFLEAKRDVLFAGDLCIRRRKLWLDEVGR